MVKIVYVHLSMKELKEMTKVATAIQGAMSFIPEMKSIFEEAVPSTTKHSTPSSPSPTEPSA